MPHRVYMDNQSLFKSKLLKIIPTEHYLRQICISYDSYVNELEKIIEKLTPILSIKKNRELLDKKLQLESELFKESQFIQAACELAAMNEFIERNDVEFSYEKKVTPPKDVDFSLVYKSKTINVEVKCPSFEHKLDAENGEVLITSLDRAKTKNIHDAVVHSIQDKLHDSGVDSKVEKSMDNNLRTFLISAQDKLISSAIDDINILIVCCDSARDMQIWRNYLFGLSGVFTNDSFVPHNEFNRVDYILLTNLYNRHHRFYEQSIISEHWKLSSAFNFLYPNRSSNRNKLIANGKNDFYFMSEIFTNFAEKFEEYLLDKDDLPNEKKSYEAKRFTGVAWFSDKYREMGIYHFREPKGI